MWWEWDWKVTPYSVEAIFLMPLAPCSQLDESPRSDRPTPRARGRQAEKEQARSARTTPTLDLFGKSRRDNSWEVEKQLKDTEEKKNVEDRFQRRFTDRKSPTDRKSLMDAKTPTGRKSPTGRTVSYTHLTLPTT